MVYNSYNPANKMINDEFLNKLVSLPKADKLMVINLLMNEEKSFNRSITELSGLGKEIWSDIDAQKYTNQERSSWD